MVVVVDKASKLKLNFNVRTVGCNNVVFDHHYRKRLKYTIGWLNCVNFKLYTKTHKRNRNINNLGTTIFNLEITIIHKYIVVISIQSIYVYGCQFDQPSDQRVQSSFLSYLATVKHFYFVVL